MKKNVLITGGACGIGAATAVLFAEKGYNVIINYNKSYADAEILSQSMNQSGFSFSAINADISNSEEVENMFAHINQRFGGVDILINNAGIAQQKLFTEISNHDWDKMISTNLSGPFFCARAAVPYMINKKCGSIINVASIWGETGASCETHYSAAKAGLIGLTKALAKELGPCNIRVNCVSPGIIATKMNDCIEINSLKLLAEETPLCRIGTASEIANTIYFLSSDYSSFITGQVISPNGGLYI